MVRNRAFVFSVLVLLAAAVLISSLGVTGQLITWQRLPGASGAGATNPWPLVSHWAFDEGTGSVALDSTPNHNDGTLWGPTWTTDSVSGYALAFDGSDDQVSVGQPSSLDLHDRVRLEAWVRRAFGQDGMIISKNGPYYMAIRDNKVEGGVYSINGGWHSIRGTTNIALNQWTKLAMEYDGIELRVFVSDNADAMLSVTGTMPHTGQDFFIGWGRPGQDQYFNGTIDEVRIFGR